MKGKQEMGGRETEKENLVCKMAGGSANTLGTCASPKLLFFKSSFLKFLFSLLFKCVCICSALDWGLQCFSCLLVNVLISHGGLFLPFISISFVSFRKCMWLSNICPPSYWEFQGQKKKKNPFNVFQPHLPLLSIIHSLLCLSHPTVSFNDPCLPYALGQFSHDFS